MAGLHFDITGDNSNFMRKLEETQRGIKNTSRLVEQEGGNIESLFNKMAKAAATFAAGLSVKEITQNIVKVRGEFQQLEVAFTTMLGSREKSSELMMQLTETAAKTPFDLQGVANGARQLLAYGTAANDVNETLIRLGNIAAGLSIPLNDLVYLYGTSMTQGRLYTQDLNQFTGRGIPMIKELAKESDLMIVVGSKKSANTTHLAEILKDFTKTIHIENDIELNKELLNNARTIGITAGASTPEQIINKVISKIKEDKA